MVHVWLLLATLLWSVAAFVPRVLLSSGLVSSRETFRMSSPGSLEEGPSVDFTSKLEIPANTDNEYLQFRLANGIEVTCVTVLNSEKASAAMSVRAGAQDDTLAGLAHFTEHAVFLGSEKFPQEDKFKAHLSKHGGSSNGGTGMDMTTFQFEVKSDALDSTLEIWSNFFVEPLFRDDAIGREVMAVTAEDSKNRILDGRRQLQVMKDLMGSSTDWAKFSTGNVNTLSLGEAEKNAKELANIMKSFHGLNYQPGKMTLALCGPQKVEELRAMAVRFFEDISAPEAVEAFELGNFQADAIPHQSEPVYVSGDGEEQNLDRWQRGWDKKKERYRQSAERNTGFPFAQDMLGSLVRLRPTKDLRDVSVMVGLPPVKDRYKRNPLRLLSHLLSYQGEGSLFAALQDLKWATAAGGSTRVSTPEFSVFEVSVSLTPAGFEHYEEVLALIYAHLNMLLEQDDAEYSRVWEELRTQSHIGFNFQEKASAYSLAQYLSRQMASMPLQHILSDGWLYEPLSGEDIALAKSLLRSVAEPSRGVVCLRNREAFDFLPDDNALAITPAKASELFPSLQGQEQADEGGATHTASGLPTGPNRVELNYGLPYHVERLPARVVQACVGVRGMEQAIEAMGADVFAEGPVREAARAVQSQFPPPNPYTCTMDELQALSASLEGEKKEDGHGSDPPVALVNEEEMGSIDMDIPWAKPVKLTREGVWLSRDQMFAQPRTQVNVFVQGFEGGDGHPMNGLLSSVFYLATAKRFYPARVAGLGFSVSAGPRGIGFSFYGYSPKLSAFAKDVVGLFTSPAFWGTVDPALVSMCQERLVRSLRSWRKERPDSLADGIMSYYLAESQRYLPDERLALAADMAYEAFVARALALATSQGVGRVGVRSHLHGSLDGSAVQEIHAAVKAGLGMPSVPVPAPGSDDAPDADSGSGSGSGTDSDGGALASVEALQAQQAERGYGMTDPPCLARLLPAGTHSTVVMRTPNEEDENSALLVHFQTDRMSPATTARMLFLRRFLHQPFFDKLRTKKQLGYIVSMGSSGYGTARGRRSMRGFTARVLSNRWAPPAMQRELEIFLREMERVILSELTQEGVQERAAAIVSSLRDPPTSYREEADDFWGSILDERGFDWAERVIQELEALSLSVVQDCYQRWFLNKGGAHRSLAVMLYGKGKTVTLAEEEVNAESAEGCRIAPLDGTMTIFPAAAAGTGTGTGTGTEGCVESASGVKQGALITSLEGLKDSREALELFNPPDDDDDDDDADCEDGCDLTW